MSVVLPAPFGPEVPEGGAFRDLEIDVVDCDPLPEPLGEAGGLDDPVAASTVSRNGCGHPSQRTPRSPAPQSPGIKKLHSKQGLVSGTTNTDI